MAKFSNYSILVVYLFHQKLGIIGRILPQLLDDKVQAGWHFWKVLLYGMIELSD